MKRTSGSEAGFEFRDATLEAILTTGDLYLPLQQRFLFLYETHRTRGYNFRSHLLSHFDRRPSVFGPKK